MSVKVQSYFHRTSRSFDALYSRNKNWHQRLGDQLFHRVINDRFIKSFEEMGDLRRNSLLDVGCGSGRYLVEAARRGARLVTGIDFAPNMIDLTRANLDEAGFLPVARLLQEEFLAIAILERHDFITAIGYFDYIQDPIAHLTKMKDIADRKVIMSFPKRWTLRTLTRKMRLTLAGCPVFFYDKQDLKDLFQKASLSRYKILSLSRDYLVVAETGVGEEGNRI